MTPLAHYRRDLERDDFVPDAAQERAVEHLQQLYEALLTERRATGWLARFLERRGWRSAPRSDIRGLYLWGGVGRGKTYLMDIFFETLPFAGIRDVVLSPGSRNTPFTWAALLGAMLAVSAA